MSARDVMLDPFYGPILFAIERRIGAVDRDARSRNLALTDSQIRSILNKARKNAAGGLPHVQAASDREQLLAALYEDLLRLRTEIRVKPSDGEGDDEGLPIQDWILALRAIEESIHIHSSGPGSRGYLNYLQGFLAQVRQ